MSGLRAVMMLFRILPTTTTMTMTTGTAGRAMRAASARENG
jgi:hypothetical protein